MKIGRIPKASPNIKGNTMLAPSLTSTEVYFSQEMIWNSFVAEIELKKHLIKIFAFYNIRLTSAVCMKHEVHAKECFEDVDCVGSQQVICFCWLLDLKTQSLLFWKTHYLYTKGDEIILFKRPVALLNVHISFIMLWCGRMVESYLLCLIYKQLWDSKGSP